MTLSSPAKDAAAGLDGIARLSHTGVIAVAGADGPSFLHSQLSNDFDRLDAARARLAAYCSPKGRMLASLIGLRRDADTLWLVLRADLLAPTLKRLSMFVLRAKAKLTDASASLAVLGLTGPSARAALGDAAGALPVWGQLERGDARVVRLPDGAGQPRFLWIGPNAEAGALAAAHPALPLAHWDWLEVASGVAPVVAATVEQFVPQMLNYELVGGVNFQKGCYPGQEIVARSQYRGTLKRRAQRVDGPAEMMPGQEVFWSGDPGQPSGLVAAAAPQPDGAGFSALVELKLAALAGGTLHLGAPDGPALTLGTLPYAMPAADAAA
ncbi:YgfZ/GcvT domain-containing protein [Caldimonas sp. KR1-144]|uniref:CAF17-like 4Fe-4S cluster assembly/insertion protein YgfZ n=1 Tax=Caldimonas sp. KR1-144 TaxID=3400911 RepID=UPI003C119AEA